ncbi:MAG: hypothetical protein UFP03_06495 [Paludibacteraceae bacterium]|nr:hypothetical protein [Paludibacteraceae bacterium]
MRLLRTFLVLMMLQVIPVVTINANVVTKVGKALKSAVQKSVSSANKSKATAKPYRYSGFKHAQEQKICHSCNGNKKISVWNAYYGVWQWQTCYTCGGTGYIQSKK